MVGFEPSTSGKDDTRQRFRKTHLGYSGLSEAKACVVCVKSHSSESRAHVQKIQKMDATSSEKKFRPHVIGKKEFRPHVIRKNILPNLRPTLKNSHICKDKTKNKNFGGGDRTLDLLRVELLTGYWVYIRTGV